MKVEDFEDELLLGTLEGGPTINYLDPVRQEHTDTVIGHIGNRTFNDYHDSLKEYHETVKSLDSGNDKHPEPLSKT